ncbi:MAG TPA: hypothetical protein VFC13_10740, partial [Actinomycetes bacterium]|nr:hypothetical protein [Actinomycetes bacterium]
MTNKLWNYYGITESRGTTATSTTTNPSVVEPAKDVPQGCPSWTGGGCWLLLIGMGKGGSHGTDMIDSIEPCRKQAFSDLRRVAAENSHDENP